MLLCLLDLDVESGMTVGYLDLHLDFEDLTYDLISHFLSEEVTEVSSII